MTAPVIGKAARRSADAAEGSSDVLGDHHDSVAAESWLRGQAMNGTNTMSYSAGQLAAEQARLGRRLRHRWPQVFIRLSEKRLRRWCYEYPSSEVCNSEGVAIGTRRAASRSGFQATRGASRARVPCATIVSLSHLDDAVGVGSEIGCACHRDDGHCVRTKALEQPQKASVRHLTVRSGVGARSRRDRPRPSAPRQNGPGGIPIVRPTSSSWPRELDRSSRRCFAGTTAPTRSSTSLAGNASGSLTQVTKVLRPRK